MAPGGSQPPPTSSAPHTTPPVLHPGTPMSSPVSLKSNATLSAMRHTHTPHTPKSTNPAGSLHDTSRRSLDMSGRGGPLVAPPTPLRPTPRCALPPPDGRIALLRALWDRARRSAHGGPRHACHRLRGAGGAMMGGGGEGQLLRAQQQAVGQPRV